MAVLKIGLNEPSPSSGGRRLQAAPAGLEYKPTFFQPPPLHRSILRQIRERFAAAGELGMRAPETGSLPRLPVSDLRPWFLELRDQLDALVHKPDPPRVSSKPVIYPHGWADYHRQKCRQTMAQGGDEMPPNVLLEVGNDADRWQRQAMFFLSVTCHGLLMLFLIFAPRLLGGERQLIAVQGAAEKPELGPLFLWLPPELRQPSPSLEPRIESDQDRTAQGKAPEIFPDAPRVPYSKGDTDLPEIAGGGGLVAPPGAPALPPSPEMEKTEGEDGDQEGKGRDQQELEKQENQQVASLKLMEVPKRLEGSGRKMKIPVNTPGQALEENVRTLSRQGETAPPGPGSSVHQFNNPFANFSTEAPLILSDTRGVDFGPYLARLVFTVRRNWYMVIPEVARLGRKGRVVIVFDILRDGRVLKVHLVGSSGTLPLDRAALAAIKMSIPCPPLPEEFSGNHLRLQFTFLYNMRFRA